MNARPKFLLLASLVSAALACSACGSGRQELQAALPPEALVNRVESAQLAAESPTPEAERRAFTPVVAPGDGIELEDKSIVEKNDKNRYEIDLTFPQLKGRLSPQAEKFNRAVRTLVAREVRDFKPTYADLKDKFWEEAADYALRGEYQFTHFADDLISLRLTLFVDNGGAHSIQLHRVLNFDLKSGRVLKLGDLFRPGERHLQALAAYCIADLKRQDEEYLRRATEIARRQGTPASRAGSFTRDFQIGAGPEAENYGAWNLAAEGVVVSFAACRVFSCADGEKEVLVPYSVLEEILNQDGPAARLATRPAR
jgi:hypothetical protein